MFLKNLWYFALPARAVGPGDMVHKALLGEPVVIGRTSEGDVFALRDICPHRGVPLSAGRLCAKGEAVDGRTLDAAQIECPYHGWRFGTDGRCAAIPSLTADQNMDIGRIRVWRYPAAERNGNIWIYVPERPDAPLVEDMPHPELPPPELPGIGERRPGLVERMAFDCHVDHAVIGLMDPAHGPFVHRAWWWRTARSIHEKAKRFGPAPLGFSMLAHKPSKNSFFYKVLGGDVTTEITFRLPGIRTELISVGRRGAVLGLTTVTPLTETQTEVTQSFYWTLPWLTPAKEFLRPLVRTFLRQDHDMVMLQKEGLKYEPRLMLINDADMQAKWYFRLKDAWDEAQRTGKPFEHPVREEVTLRWRS
jgi:phenylpropionate dioxygenase-like ring-hydroxylating dioxygenase large terminal subunit